MFFTNVNLTKTSPNLTHDSSLPFHQAVETHFPAFVSYFIPI